MIDTSLLNKRITRIKFYFYDYFHPLIINGALYYSNGRLLPNNWGDDLNINFLSKIIDHKIAPLFFASGPHYNVVITDLHNRENQINYCVIGSSIDMLVTRNSIIWGAGVMGDREYPVLPQKVLAVRGPLSRDYLLAKGLDCPPIYGDPAMLLKYYYQPNSSNKKYKIGVIPHYVDANNPILGNLKQDPDVLFIYMQDYGEWTDVIDKIAQCECIASSSLHGLIVAETYDIPNLWVEVSPHESHFKYHDFFLSVGVDRNSPYQISSQTTSVKLIEECKKTYVKGYINLLPLISASPFKLKNLVVPK